MNDLLSNQKLKFHSFRTDFYEGTSKKYGRVLIQKPRTKIPTMQELVSIKNDFEFSHNLDLNCILKGHELIRSENIIVTIKDYFDGITLEKYIKSTDISLPIFFKIANNLVELLGMLHDNKVLIKDLCPENLLISLDTHKIKVTEFGIASEIEREHLDISSLDSFNGALHYMAPEQTGRIGRSIDYRSDYYALGVIFYELLCNRLPFTSESTIELIHAHIAKQAIEPYKLNPEIPEQVSDLVMKLLSKNAEERYQSSGGINKDLQECFKQFQHKGFINKFELGLHDHSNVFLISEKLYGRKSELKLLEDAFARITLGPIEGVFVGGYSGIGKTRLIQELQDQIVKKSGFFVSGKFDQFNRDNPYFAFTQSLNALVYQLISEDQALVSTWKNEILYALEGNGAALLEVAPDLELLIGPQGENYDLGLQDNKDRFSKTILDFLSVLDKHHRPLVIFIDDLQWADSNSLELISTLLKSELNNILLIGAYRDNEVSESHPLHMHLTNFRQEIPSRIQEINVKELKEEAVNQLIANTLRVDESQSKNLSHILFSKTYGNPFFITQFLERLVSENFISFNQTNKKWTWDLNTIDELNVTDNVVDLVVNKIKTISEGSQKILSLAACIGNVFQLNMLSIISELSASDTAKYIHETIKEGFLYPIGNWSKFSEDELWQDLGITATTTTAQQFKFQHDKIQQAAYSLISDDKKVNTHYTIGNLLKKELSESELDEHVFDVLHHLNLSSNLITDVDEKIELARLNFLAGKKAKAAIAINAASNYLKTGMDLIPRGMNQELYTDILITRSECEYLSGNYTESENLFDIAISDTKSKLDKAQILSKKMALYENTQRHSKAIDTAKEGLKYLGMDLNTAPSQLVVMKELMTVKFLLRNKTMDQLLNMEVMSSPKIALTMQILMNLWGPVYLLQKQNLLAFKILRMVRLSVKYGNSPESALAYAFYGYVLSAQLKDYNGGYKLSRLGLKLNQKLNDLTLQPKTIVIADGCVAHWKKPFDEIIPNMRKAYTYGIESNDIIYAGYACTFVNRAIIFKGENLLSCYKKFIGFYKFLKQINSILSQHQLVSLERFVIKLSGLKPKEKVFADFETDEIYENHLKKLLEEQKMPLPLCSFYISKSMYSYYFKEYETGIDAGIKAEPLIPAVLGLPETAEQTSYFLLNVLGAARKDKSILKSNKKQFNTYFKDFKKQASHSPRNYMSRFRLIEAEMAVVNGQYILAEEKYDQATKEARHSNHSHIMAITNERRAELYLSRYDFEKGYKFLRSAMIDYRDWGAMAKVKLLEQQLPKVQTSASTAKEENQITSGHTIDLQTLINTATTISGEVVFEELLAKLLNILIKNAGAQNAYFFLARPKGLRLEAMSRMDNDFLCQFNKLFLQDVTNIATSIVQFAFNSKKTIIIDDASKDPLTARDNNTSVFKSIICMPIVKNNEILALVYLDNNISANTFTKDRANLLQLISGQIAVSIENAMLYENLENKVKERTKTIELQKTELESEKIKSDELLLNILPLEVANDLKKYGHYKPKFHENVSIMFSDFEEFTKLAQTISAEELVEMMDHCYKAFDHICEKHHIEKIKTIGDAYMCVAGLSGTRPNHAERIILAGQEIVDFIHDYNETRKADNKPYCRIRVGIHSGAVVAGVVGHRKFAFDIWGDSVNTASRMQSYGGPGKINISETTWNIVHDHFNCIPRGAVEVKNKGKINMFFVEK